WRATEARERLDRSGVDDMPMTPCRRTTGTTGMPLRSRRGRKDRNFSPALERNRRNGPDIAGPAMISISAFHETWTWGFRPKMRLLEEPRRSFCCLQVALH